VVNPTPPAARGLPEARACRSGWSQGVARTL
jgi:hypothetical protein